MRPTWRSGIPFLFLLFCAADASAERRFVYTNDDVAGPNTVSGFRVHSNGTLVPVPGSPFSTGGTGNHGGFFATNRAAVFANRDLLFVSNGGSNDISVFRIDRLTGSLALVSGSPFSSEGVSGLGISLATTPDGRFLIAANAVSSPPSSSTSPLSFACDPSQTRPCATGSICSSRSTRRT